MKLLQTDQREQFLNEVQEKIKKKKFFRQIQNYIDHNPLPEMYWDYRESLSEAHVEKIVSGGEEAVFEIEDELWEMNIDYIIELENEYLEQISPVFEEQAALFGYEGEDYQDLLKNYIYVDVNLKDLIRLNSDIPVRVALECNTEGFYYDYWKKDSYQGGDYFKPVVDALNLNPRKVKQALHEKLGVSIPGKWPDYKWRNKKEIVSYDDFIRELNNIGPGPNVLTFAARLDLSDLKEAQYKITKLKIPAGNSCGFFNPCCGAGSLMEMQVLKDTHIKLKNNSEYDGFRLVLDNNSNGYSIDEVYGVTGEFWGKCIEILK